MRGRGWIAALLSAALIAAPSAHAQQQEPSLPERVIEGIGGAIRGIFEQLFGNREREGEIPQPPSQPPPQPPQEAAAPPAPVPPVSSTF